MRYLRSMVLYAGLTLTATTAAAADIAELEALREGLMQKLNFHEEPRDGSDVAFFDPDGGEHTLADYQGKYVVLNFWATWCTPCRKEMPSLDRLQAEMGSDNFEVVPVATSRNPMPAIERFFEQENIAELPILLDPSRELAADLAVLSLPVTMILNPEGQEIARLIGDAEWDSDSAKAIFAALLAEE